MAAAGSPVARDGASEDVPLFSSLAKRQSLPQHAIIAKRGLKLVTACVTGVEHDCMHARDALRWCLPAATADAALQRLQPARARP